MLGKRAGKANLRCFMEGNPPKKKATAHSDGLFFISSVDLVTVLVDLLEHLRGGAAEGAGAIGIGLLELHPAHRATITNFLLFHDQLSFSSLIIHHSTDFKLSTILTLPVDKASPPLTTKATTKVKPKEIKKVIG